MVPLSNSRAQHLLLSNHFLETLSIKTKVKYNSDILICEVSQYVDILTKLGAQQIVIMQLLITHNLW